MQSTGQTSTHAVSLVPTHGSQMIYANILIILGLAAALKAPVTCDPALTALFTPARPELGRYEVCTSDERLEGDAESVDALDAFGAAGPYDRAKLQRLYGGTHVRITRSWTADASALVSTTRLSPYPDASLTQLHAGTMEIRFTIPRGL